MDSDKMLAVFKKNPNIITWMHGHNHNFEVVKQEDMLFVSNGRIGGFDPSSGKYGIGGVYFEITKDKLIVKCYSAEKDMFLDSFDESLSQTLDVKTTFDNNGNKFTIVGKNNSKENFYIQSTLLNNKIYSHSYINFKDIQNGGKLEFNLGKNPNPSWGHKQTDVPYSLSLETHN